MQALLDMMISMRWLEQAHRSQATTKHLCRWVTYLFSTPRQAPEAVASEPEHCLAGGAAPAATMWPVTPALLPGGSHSELLQTPIHVYLSNASVEARSSDQTCHKLFLLFPIQGTQQHWGSAQVVSKLFNIVEPDVAVFGQKDYQQLQIIKRLVRDLDFAIKIVGQPIARESDGLAMSRRVSLTAHWDLSVLHERMWCMSFKNVPCSMPLHPCEWYIGEALEHNADKYMLPLCAVEMLC